MYKCNLFDKISFVLVIIGAINWGLFGLFDFDLICFLFNGLAPIIARAIYILVGLSGINMILFIFKTRK